MTKRKTAAITAGVALIAASVIGLAAPASAETLHGGYATKSACIAAAGTWELHGYVIFQNCYNPSGTTKWYFITTP